MFTYHTRYGDYAKTYFPFIPPRIVDRYVTRMTVRFMNQCDAVTVSTDTLGKELAASGVRVPVSVVPPGIDTVRFAKGNRAAFRSRFGFGRDDTVLLYAGRLSKEKNIYFLLDAFLLMHARNAHVRLVMSGAGLEQEAILAFVRSNGIDASVHIVTDYTYDTLPDVYAGSDMFVYASQTETFGRVVAEAMSAGLPVVALSAPALTDLVDDGITGRLVRDMSAEDFATTVLELLSHPTVRRDMGSMGRKKAQRTYDNAVSFGLLERVYSSISAKSIL